ncbi:hypothetical protein, partial [Prevotella nigrescens]|uniref:hypothetical protein n=1 Tax=Prevotella nigrescens TaxID=28133 RepID=UPI003C75775D
QSIPLLGCSSIPLLGYQSFPRKTNHKRYYIPASNGMSYLGCPLSVCSKARLQTFAPALTLILHQAGTGKGNKLYICEHKQLG